MPDNPYAPPEAPAPPEPDTPKSLRGAPYFVLLVSFALYIIAIEGRVDTVAIKEQLASGAMPALPNLCFLIGSGALLAGIGRQMYAPWEGKYGFILAAPVLAIGLVADASSGSSGAMRAVFALGMASALIGISVVWRVKRILIAQFIKQKGEPGE